MNALQRLRMGCQQLFMEKLLMIFMFWMKLKYLRLLQRLFKSLIGNYLTGTNKSLG